MRLRAVALLTVALAGCGPAGARLSVDLVTDVAPVTEFRSVRVERLGGTGAVLETMSVAADRAASYVHGVRVAELSGLALQDQTIRVALLDATGHVVVERTAEVLLRGDYALTIVLTRSCLTVTCPAVGGDRTLTECSGGRCVDPRCRPDDPSSCLPAACSMDSQCVPAVSCAVGHCVSGDCLFADEGACGTMRWCDPSRGCEVLPPPPIDSGVPLDSGTPIDAGRHVDAGHPVDSGGPGVDAFVDTTPPTIDIAPIADPAPSGYMDTPNVAFSYSCTAALSACDLSTVSCAVDGVPVMCGPTSGAVPVGDSGAFAFGDHTLTVQIANVAGIVGTASQPFTVTRCAGDMQFPGRTSNGLTRGGCCGGLVVANWDDIFAGYWHPRGDASCRPMSDYASTIYETIWGGGSCVGGMTTTQWLQDMSLPGCATAAGRSACVASQATAQEYCGTDGLSGTQTPLHGRAGEGWHPAPSAGCSGGTMSSTLLMQRYGTDNVCWLSLDQAALRGSVTATDACKSPGTRYCRTNPVAAEVACVCATSDPYADDGRH